MKGAEKYKNFVKTHRYRGSNLVSQKIMISFWISASTLYNRDNNW